MAIELDDLVEFITNKECSASPGSEQALIYREEVKKALLARYWRGTVAVAVDFDYPKEESH
jgi:hypothetical protein